MTIEKRLLEMSLELPEPNITVGLYVPAVVVGNLIFSSGQIPVIGGVLQYKGRLGDEIDIEEGRQAAKLAVLNCLAGIKSILGTLEKVERVVKLKCYVASAEGFVDQPVVANGASELLINLFAEKGKHARTAIGVSEIPFGSPVEVEVICSTRDV